MVLVRVFGKSTLFTWFMWSLIFSVTGPFGTFLYLPIYWQMVFWITLTTLIIICLKLTDYTLNSLLKIKGMLLLQVGSVSATSAIVFSGMVLMPSALRLNSVFVEWGRTPLFGSILFCSAIIKGTGEYAEKFWTSRDLILEVPRLLERLDTTDTTIMSISARDHQVEITCPSGQHALRIRFADAVQETAPVKGYVIHRSHRVAEEAIENIFERQTRYLVRLRNGAELPISSAGRKTLNEAGVFGKYLAGVHHAVA